jgi:polar amino acid transport system substrate-binding protein
MTARRRRLLAVLALTGTGVLAACSAPAAPPDTPPAPAPSASLGSASRPAESCDDKKARSASYPASTDKTRGFLATIVQRGRLVVGVSGDSYRLGAFKPGSVTEFDGFDIAVAREVARDLLGSPDKITFKVITAADRDKAVNAGVDKNGVDLVARAYTMDCDRWKLVSFSAAYFKAAQDTLVRKGASEKTLKELGTDKKTVCAPNGSTSIKALPRLAPGAVPYPADQHTACLALMQEGVVDAITGDNTVLAGLQAQDPGTRVLGESLSSEPYGLAAAKAHPELAQFANSVLERIEKDGTWQRLYDTYFKSALGPGSPPKLDLTKPLPS